MLASMAAIRAVPVVPGYGSGKAGVLALTRNLAAKWAVDGIQVNAVVPGLVACPDDRAHGLRARYQARADRSPLLGRFATPAEIANPIL